MLKRILGKDPDEAFPYQTERILIIRELLLAIIGYIFTFAVLFYIIFYVFFSLEKYKKSST
jgi:ATP P2X receptor.